VDFAWLTVVFLRAGFFLLSDRWFASTVCYEEIGIAGVGDDGDIRLQHTPGWGLRHRGSQHQLDAKLSERRQSARPGLSEFIAGNGSGADALKGSHEIESN
jgi:hypothetical protein